MRPLFLFFFTVAEIFSHAQSNIDVLHYRFHIGLNDENDTLYGVAIVNFSVVENSSAIILDLAALNEAGKGMIVTKADFNNTNLIASKFSLRNDKLIFTGAKFKKGDTTAVIISYKGIPADGLIISKNKFGRRTFFADNWPNHAHHWLPCHDDPADKASVEFIVTAPDHYQVVANGVQVEESSVEKGFKLTRWKEDVPLPTKVMTLGVAEFATELVGTVNDCIPVYSWAFPENAKEAAYDFALTADILRYYIKTIGPYGYKKLANVQSKTQFGGLENASAIFYGENKITGTRSNESLLAHEITHQWFGNMATEKSFGHLWLSEGFATYFTTLYFENKYGNDTAAKMRKQDRDEVIAFSKYTNSPVVNTAETDYMNLLNENSYQKGGWVLHMLRRQLGDSVFWKAIRKYYAAYAGKNADTDDLRKIVETVSGKNLNQFFTQWLFTPGQPDLNINWKYNSKTKKADVTVQQKQKAVFTFPLEIVLQLNSGQQVKQIVQVSQQSATYSFPVKEKPAVLIADPDTHLLFETVVREIK